MQLQDNSSNRKPYPVPENEEERNEALRSYRIMDSPPEIAWRFQVRSATATSVDGS
jgi:hypothetical protein